MHEPAGVVEILVQILQNTPILKYSFRIPPLPPPPQKWKLSEILALWLFSFKIPPFPRKWKLGRSWHFKTMCGKLPHVETLSSPDNYSFYWRTVYSTGTCFVLIEFASFVQITANFVSLSFVYVLYFFHSHFGVFMMHNIYLLQILDWPQQRRLLDTTEEREHQHKLNEWTRIGCTKKSYPQKDMRDVNSNHKSHIDYNRTSKRSSWMDKTLKYLKYVPLS